MSEYGNTKTNQNWCLFYFLTKYYLSPNCCIRNYDAFHKKSPHMTLLMEKYKTNVALRTHDAKTQNLKKQHLRYDTSIGGGRLQVDLWFRWGGWTWGINTWPHLGITFFVLFLKRWVLPLKKKRVLYPVFWSGASTIVHPACFVPYFKKWGIFKYRGTLVIMLQALLKKYYLLCLFL